MGSGSSPTNGPHFRWQPHKGIPGDPAQPTTNLAVPTSTPLRFNNLVGQLTEVRKTGHYYRFIINLYDQVKTNGRVAKGKAWGEEGVRRFHALPGGVTLEPVMSSPAWKPSTSRCSRCFIQLNLQPSAALHRSVVGVTVPTVSQGVFLVTHFHPEAI